ncbi:MAG: glycoside hydrolase family 3 N-terminal domain-containing protein [Bacteroidia bacterium]|nr:glycoside hydrolase family 3 N-terminal domain-containing protein [Bacteroidia bacterium]
MWRFVVVAVLVVGVGKVAAQMPDTTPGLPELFPDADSAWVKRTLASMSLDEKLGQLFMVQTWTAERLGGKPVYNRDSIEHWIERYHIGGVIFMQGGPHRTAWHTNHYQRLSKTPLLMGADYEWGLGMRLDSVLIYPRNIALGAIENDSLLYQFGKEVARQSRAVGIHLNFAPVVDVNNNPQNPVIGDRSFGTNKHLVTQKALMVMNGLKAGGAIACAKHFPGHGDTDTDSHFDLPVITHDRTRLDSLELYPFRQLVRYGVPSVMVAHLHLPKLDTATNRASTLSPSVVGGLLRTEARFQGLVITDALNMQGVAKYRSQAELALEAFRAGNDILLCPEQIGTSLDTLRRAVADGRIQAQDLDARVTRILWAKAWLGLHRSRQVDTTDLEARLKPASARELQQTLYRESLTLVQNRRNWLPLKDLQGQKLVYLQLGTDAEQAFYHRLRIHVPLQVLVLKDDLTEAQADSIGQLLVADRVTTAIAGFYDLSRRPARQYGLRPGHLRLLSYLYRKNVATVAVFFGNPYALEYFPQVTSALIAYEEWYPAQVAAADALVGAVPLVGRLGVEVPNFRYERPQYDSRTQRLGFEPPQRLGFDPEKLEKIDSIAQHFIRERHVPGMAVLVARRGQVVYDRGFGRLDYSAGAPPVDPYSCSYDLASVSKVMGTTLAAMRLFETQRLNLQAPVAEYLPEATGTAIGQVKVESLLLHESGLPAWKPFYTQYLAPGGGLDSAWVRSQATDTFALRLGPELWLHRAVPGQIVQKILQSPLEYAPGTKHVYSDFGMILLGKIIERITGQPLDRYLATQFYRPLGMHRTAYTPAADGLALTTPPTEEDKHFRNGRLEGYVNDANSALLGGVAGHAGLFGNVYDLAKALTMLQQGGSYGGVQYFDPFTVQYFTSARTKVSRRGLGWDKPDPKNPANSPCSRYASPESYGHLGFTGTAVWVDPVHELVVVILANRTYPDPENKAYAQQNARGLIHDAVYQALGVATSPVK